MAALQPEHEHEHETAGSSGGTASPQPAGPAPAPAPPAQHGRGRLRGHLGRLHGWATAAAVMVVVAALAALLLGRAGLLGAGDGASGSTSWHTYNDPFGLFTLRVPPDWATHYAPTTGTFGDRYGMETERVDMVSFDDPAQGTGSAYILVTAYPIKTAFDHEHNCQQPANLQPFTPLTLSSMVPSGHQLFTTETAGFQVDVGIPGVVMPPQFGAPTPVPTPLPAAWVAADKSAVNAMLVSFQPTDPKPLTC